MIARRRGRLAAMAESGEQVVTPWEAHAAEGAAKIDFDKLIRKTITRLLVLETSGALLSFFLGGVNGHRSVWEHEDR